MKNIKKIVFHFVCITIFLASFFTLKAQPFNNSWINYNQQYFQFKIAETGIFRIDSTTLFNAGIPLSSINPQNFQLFARGQEIPIYIEGENDGIFNQNDFIEFYAQHNDGWFDEGLYGSVIDHPNPYYSLTTDTISYFLTWNNLTTNNRIIVETDTNFSAYTPIAYFTKENVEFYTAGNGTSNPYYDGETINIGGSGVSRNSTSSNIYRFSIIIRVRRSISCSIKLNVFFSKVSNWSICRKVSVCFYNNSIVSC